MTPAVLIPNRTKAVGYLRRSTDRQEQSIPDQKRAVEAYALQHGLRLVHFYIDDAISGTSTIGRKAFMQMIADAQRGDRSFSAIVVYDVKRFGRVDNDEAGYYRHILRENGVEVLYASENFTGDGTDDLLRPVKQWQAREESKDLSKVTIRGLLSKAEGGWWMGGVPPHGYDLRYESAEGKFLFILRHYPDGTKELLDEQGHQTRTLARGERLNISKRDRAKLIFSLPERVAAVREIFRLYVQEGRGHAAIADALNRKGYVTPRGPAWSPIYSGQWTDTTVRSILVNPIYAGDMVWNRRTDGRFHKIHDRRAVPRNKIHGARLEPNDETDWLIIPDTHEALIPKHMFIEAKTMREAKAAALAGQEGEYRSEAQLSDTTPTVGPRGGWQGARSRFILSGLLKCAKCGNRYQGFTRQKGKPRLDGTKIKNYYYGCGGHITKGNTVCQLGAIPQNDLEMVVIDAVLNFYKPYTEPGGSKKLAALIEHQHGKQTGDLKDAQKRLAEKQLKLTTTINNLLDNITADNRAYIDQRLKELQAERDALDLQKDELEGLILSQAQTQSTQQNVVKFIAGLEYILREGVPEEKKAVLRQCIRQVAVDAGAKQIKIELPIIPTTSAGAVQSLTVKIP